MIDGIGGKNPQILSNFVVPRTTLPFLASFKGCESSQAPWTAMAVKNWVNSLKIDETAGTWLVAHFRHQARRNQHKTPLASISKLSSMKKQSCTNVPMEVRWFTMPPHLLCSWIEQPPPPLPHTPCCGGLLWWHPLKKRTPAHLIGLWSLNILKMQGSMAPPFWIGNHPFVWHLWGMQGAGQQRQG